MESCSCIPARRSWPITNRACYPINLLAFLVFPNLSHQAMEGLVIFHLWLAGAAMYVALRLWPPLSSPPFHGGDREGVKPLPALLGAVAFMFNDVLITHIGNLNLIAVAAWLPLILAFYALGLSERRVGWMPVPRTHLLSNGRYAVLITSAGSGYSRWRELAITRWRGDVTCDPGGAYVCLRDAQTGEVWSAGYQPSGVEPDACRGLALTARCARRRLRRSSRARGAQPASCRSQIATAEAVPSTWG